MRRLWMLLAAWVLLAIGVWQASAKFAPAGLSDNGYQIEPGWYMRLGELYWDEATGHLLLCSEWAADCPPGAPVTPEPEPSEAPGTVPGATPLPTYTPYPTLTPWPTYTPYPTYTPPASATPTPETDITPQPTIERFCEAQVQGSFHVVRTDRSTSAQAVGSMAPSTWMRVERIVRNAQGEWLYGTGENANGTAITGWALATDNLVLQDSQACWAVPYEDEIDPLPTIAPTATPQTVTPVPTEPQPGDCVYSHVFAMTIRSGPGTNYSRVGTLPANVSVPVGHIYPDTAAERWAFITHEGATGWVAVRAGGVSYGALSGDCSKVPRTAPSLNNPRGLHLIYSANKQVVQDVLPTLGTIKATDGAEWALPMAKEHDPRIVTVYRAIYTPWGKLDCPPGWGVGDPVQAANDWYDMLVGVWSTRGLLGQVDTPSGPVRVVDYFEYRNECGFTGAWEVAFDRQMLRRASASEICLLAFSDAYGTPELHEFAQRRPVLDEMLAQPCRPGQWHGIALHGYSKHDSGPWLFGRWRLFRESVGHKYDAIQYWFTEWGVPNSRGEYDGRGTPDCAAMAAELAIVDPILRDDPGVGGYHAYSVGHGTEWTDLTPCLALL